MTAGSRVTMREFNHVYVIRRGSDGKRLPGMISMKYKAPKGKLFLFELLDVVDEEAPKGQRREVGS